MKKKALPKKLVTSNVKDLEYAESMKHYVGLLRELALTQSGLQPTGFGVILHTLLIYSLYIEMLSNICGMDSFIVVELKGVVEDILSETLGKLNEERHNEEK